VALLAVAVLLLVWWWVGQGPGGLLDEAAPGGTSAASSVSAAAPVPNDESGLPRVVASDLPAQARQTLDLIAAGGPYPYPRDGVVFQNRERLLPRKAGGYYREYTVPTPGEADRGPRRIITGKGGERYWTADHYASFSVIMSNGSEGGAP
jgi:ribonuclease T1